MTHYNNFITIIFFPFFSNIDIRIQHAELEYQLGKEELNLLNILEEFRNLQNSIENNYSNGKGVGGYFHESLSIYK